jgi:phage shock protein E
MDRFFIDVREPEEYATGHVENAINIPPAELLNNSKQLVNIPKNAEIVLYCKSGSRSNVSKNILESMGYTNVINGINKDHVKARYGV